MDRLQTLVSRWAAKIPLGLTAVHANRRFG
jgi:hypothetical protein